MPRHYHSYSDLPGSLPLFPLTGAVLLPRGQLPLNIFEPRYREMVSDCLRDDQSFGVVLIERGSEVGGGDQRARGRLERLVTSEHRGYLFVADHRRKPIAAEQQQVAVAPADRLRVGLNDRLRPQRTRDDRALRMIERLLLRQLTLPNHLLNQRVVIGQALERAVTPAVATAVTDVYQRHIVLADVGGSDGGSHSGTLIISDRKSMDL